MPKGSNVKLSPSLGGDTGWLIDTNVTTLGESYKVHTNNEALFGFIWLTSSQEDFWNITQSENRKWCQSAYIVSRLDKENFYPFQASWDLSMYEKYTDDGETRYYSWWQ